MSVDIKYMDRIAALITTYVRGTLSEEEAIELEVWCAQSVANQILFDNLSDPEYVNDYIKDLPNIQSLKTAGRDRLNLVKGGPEKGAIAKQYNAITTPGAGQFELLLPYGSKVWLNNASSLRDRMAFIEEDRAVELKREAYFEIAYAAGQPFKVLVGYMMWTCRDADAGQVV